jgi:SNF2 family DNA or RNA helicase
MNAKQKDAAKDKFMEDPECKVFIGNLDAAGVGLTLTAATALVFNNISFVPGSNQQFQDRVHRLNQTEDVDIYYQIFRGTQYEKMWDIVLRKTLVIDQVIKKEEEK